VGEIFEIEESSRYAMVDMPKGTEFRIESIQPNVIIERMMQSERTRKTPIERWPKGDPQWFPLEWLTVVNLQQPELPGVVDTAT
jgi:hypothetical protein